MSVILEIHVDKLKDKIKEYVLVDVREPDELLGPEGMIEGVILAPLGTALAHFLRTADADKKYVFICKSGVRSRIACEIAQTYGFPQASNLRGGMVEWNKGER